MTSSRTKTQEFLDVSRTYEPDCMNWQAPVVWDHASGAEIWDVDGKHYIDWTSGVLVANVGHAHPAAGQGPGRPGRAAAQHLRLPDAGEAPAGRNGRQGRPGPSRQGHLPDHGLRGHGRGHAPGQAVHRQVRDRLVLGQLPRPDLRPHEPERHPEDPPELRAPRAGHDPRALSLLLSLPVRQDPSASAISSAWTSSTSWSRSSRPVLSRPSSSSPTRARPDSSSRRRAGSRSSRPGRKGKGLLFILDEVQSSFGRTGKMWALEHEGLEPDILVLGKGIGSGAPIAALVTRSSIISCLERGEMSSTLGGNPLSCGRVARRLRDHRKRGARRQGGQERRLSQGQAPRP